MGGRDLTWRPVRMTLDLRAFGTNAYTANEAGVDVVEPHDEDPKLAHEELYFVHRGSARFTLDGESFDAPAGTYVRVTDPKVHRHAVALEPGTTILSFGGPRTFTPSAWEWSFKAVALRRDGDVDAARRALDEGFGVHPESPSLLYELACLEASQQRLDEAWSALARAIELEPALTRWARDDDDLRPLVSRLPQAQEKEE